MHDITIEMFSNLDRHMVETILKQFVEERTGKIVSKVEATVKDNNFTGFSIKYHAETPESPMINNHDMHTKPIKIDKTFKPMVYY